MHLDSSRTLWLFGALVLYPTLHAPVRCFCVACISFQPMWTSSPYGIVIPSPVIVRSGLSLGALHLHRCLLRSVLFRRTWTTEDEIESLPWHPRSTTPQLKERGSRSTLLRTFASWPENDCNSLMLEDVLHCFGCGRHGPCRTMERDRCFLTVP